MIDPLFFEKEQVRTHKQNFATVTGVYNDGLTIRIDGEETPTQKHYKRNKDANFKVGDRVKIFRDSGTIIIEYVVG